MIYKCKMCSAVFNRPENLIVLKHRDHMKLHWQLAKEKGVI